MPGDEEKWSLVGSPIECAAPICGMSALTTCNFCWEHLPPDQKTGFKDKIEQLSKSRGGNLQRFILGYANLQGAVLWGAKLQSANLGGANLQGADLVHVKLQGADLAYANLQGAFLWGAKLQGADLAYANLQGTDLSEIEYDAKTSFIRTDIRNIDWSKNPSLERRIKDQQWLHDFKQKAEKSRWKKAWYHLWGETCDYGRDFWRWLRYSIYLSVFFGLIYYKFSLLNLLDAPKNLFTPFYYSIVTFTTLGFGDVVPKNVTGQIVVTIEVLLGYIMLGGLISIFANKLARRS